MNILVIEDEPLVARDLIQQIGRLRPNATIHGPLPTVAACKEWFPQHTLPDLIFSDIQLADGISFDALEELQLRCPIIFTTAYDEYAIRAFKLNSIDYLLKPIDPAELEAAFKKYSLLLTQPVFTQQIQTLVASIQAGGGKKHKERFLAWQRNTLVPVMASDIVCFHKEELIYLHTVQQEKLISDHTTLDEVESLINPETFFRVNRQYIINIRFVERIKTTHKGLSVSIAHVPGEIDISREKAVAFKTWLDK